jgi:uncharacterized delta-60 repeat protein
VTGVAGAVAALAAIAVSAAVADPAGFDNSFSGDGRRTVSLSPNDDRATGVALGPGGRIVAAGFSRTGGTTAVPAVVALKSGGQLDPAFSGDGKRTFSFGNADEEVLGVVVQGNGRIVLAGYSTVLNPSGNEDFAVARLMPNGALDHSFSGDGRRLISFGPGNDEAEGVALAPGGKVVLAGPTATGDRMAIARLNGDGSLDHGFSGDGKRLLGFAGTESEARDVAVARDGRITLAGEADDDFAAARLTAGGRPDQSFSGDGRRLIGFGTQALDSAGGVALRGGKAVLAGESIPGPEQGEFALARLRADGSLDTGFSGDGKQVTDFDPDFDGANDVGIDSNGEIVAAGLIIGSVAVARYDPDGGLDASFSGDGKRIFRFTTSSGLASGVAIQANDRIVVAGSDFSASDDFGFARLLGG